MTPPQQSPSREAVTPVAPAAASREPAALTKEVDLVKPSALVKEPPIPAKETKPQAAKEVIVSEKEEREEVKANVEEPVVSEREVKPSPSKEPEDLKKVMEEEEESESAVKEAAVPEKEAKPEISVAPAKDKKQPVEEKVEQVAEKPKEKEEKLPPTPFDDIEETDTRAAEPEIYKVLQEGEKQAEGEHGKKGRENGEQEDDSTYVYEDMQHDGGEKREDKKGKPDSEEYEIMDFNEAEEEGKDGGREGAPVTGGTAEEVARQQQQQQQARGKVHQYDQVAMDETEPRFKISSSSSKDFDGALSSSSGYEHMEPAPAVRVTDKEREPSLDGEYVPMKDGVILDQEPGEQEREGVVTDKTSTDKYEYEEPGDWVEKAPPIIRDMSPPYDSLSATRLTPSPGHNRPDELAPDAGVRRSVASSSGSIGSQKSYQTSSLEVKGGEDVVSGGDERRRGSSGASKRSSEAGSGQLQPDRDSLGVRRIDLGGGHRV